MTDWYCPLPFKHVYVDTTGISACCQTPRYQVDLYDWHNQPELLQLQKDLLEGKKPDVCNECLHQEQSFGRSLRTDSLRDYQNQIYHETDIDYIDYRSVNLCNFKCRSCDPNFSNGIAQEVRSHQSLQNFYAVPNFGKTISVKDSNIDWVYENLHQIKRLQLTGGEPTMIPGVRRLVNKVIESHRNIQIMITTNASFQDDFWFTLTEQIPNLHWTVSIDAVGQAAEIVRHGSRWNLIEKNVRWLAKNSRSLDINSVVSNLTVFSLRPLLKFGREMQMLSRSPSGLHGDLGCRHQFYVCHGEDYLNADNWPDHLKQKALDYLLSCLDLDLDFEQNNMIKGLMDQIASRKFDAQLWQSTQKFNASLDAVRNENSEFLYEAQY
jgi:organic radical activating enzyme